MENFSLIQLFKETKIDGMFEFSASLQDSVKKLFATTFSSTDKNSDSVGPIKYVPSSDKRITSITYEQYYPGRTVADAIVKVENEFPVVFSAVPTEDGGYEVTLEYRERKFGYV